MAVVRIDDELLKQVRKLLTDDCNKYQYPSVSAFINNAVYDKLRKKK
jgi:hypothetical protein